MKAILFDLGDTLIHEQVDDQKTLDQLALELQPHAAPVIQQLAERYPLGIVSDTETSSEAVVRRALRRLDVERFFDAVVTSVDIGARKPDPAIFLEALRRLRTGPAQAVMVGNDASTDITGARGVGMGTILYRSSTYYRPDLAAGADYEIDSLAEIPAIMERFGPGVDRADA